MNVLIACEYSARVRDAFRLRGHNAWSCDLLPTEGDPRWHYQEDCFVALKRQEWDLVIAHPPCTYLSNAGIRWFDENRYGDNARKRKELRLEAMTFVDKIWNCDVDKLCIENPVGYLNKNWKKPSQIIEPFHFGDEHRKRTCLWLRGLPKLTSTNVVKPKVMGYFTKGKRKGQPYYFTEALICLPHERSKTFQGIANAMAEQWGK